MAKGFKHGAGGGGTSLNFKVMCNPQPSTAKENTIWVNTDVPIPEWKFAAENPYIAKSDNLYVAATNPGYIDSNGNIQSNSDWKVTQYIELPDGTQEVTITMSSNTSESPCHAFYDASKNLLSTVYRKPNTVTYSVPVDAKYIRMSERLSESATLIASYYIDDVPEGAVWFPTGTSSSVAFNALKKNGIQVYPISAKQYIGGAWVNKTAKSYQGGEWVDWITLVYDCATLYENTDLIGANGFYMTANNPGFTGSVTKNENGIGINSGRSDNLTAVSHSARIDLSRFDKLHVLWKGGPTAYSDHQGIGIFDVNNTNIEGAAKAFVYKDHTKGEYEATLDISNIDSGYIGLLGYDAWIYFKKIWFT